MDRVREMITQWKDSQHHLEHCCSSYALRWYGPGIRVLVMPTADGLAERSFELDYVPWRKA